MVGAEVTNRMTPDELAYENHVVLMVVQSLLGLLDASLQGVAVQVSREHGIIIHFAVSHRGEAVDEVLQDIADGLKVFMSQDTPDIGMEVHVGEARPAWPGRSHRLVIVMARVGGSI